MIPPASSSGRVAFEVEGEECGEERLAGQVVGPTIGGEDGAVLAAYDWPRDLAGEPLVAALLALNLERDPA